MKIRSLKLIQLFLITSFVTTVANAQLSQSISLPRVTPAVTDKTKVEVKPEQKSGYESLRNDYASWGIEKNAPYSINLQKAWTQFNKKKNIVVAVIDTGIDPTHPFLKDNIYLPSEEGAVTPTNFGIDFSKKGNKKHTPNDEHGHGTHISGIIKSIFPDVKIMALKYYDAQASGQENLDSTIAALRYAVKNNVDMINYSGGGPEASKEEKDLLTEAEKKGILVVAAAGNEEQNIDIKKFAYFPASYGLSNIISVTTYDQSMMIHYSSNWGASSVDIAAPGTRIKSTFPTTKGQTGYLTGTSQSTAFVTGAAALIKANYPTLKPMQIKEIIKRSAKYEASLKGKCNSNGRLDVEAALTLAKKESTTPRAIASVKKTEGKIIYRLKRKK